jgi:hypothetical protein
VDQGPCHFQPASGDNLLDAAVTDADRVTDFGAGADLPDLRAIADAGFSAALDPFCESDQGRVFRDASTLALLAGLDAGDILNRSAAAAQVRCQPYPPCKDARPR